MGVLGIRQNLLVRRIWLTSEVEDRKKVMERDKILVERVKVTLAYSQPQDVPIWRVDIGAGSKETQRKQFDYHLSFSSHFSFLL